VAQNRSYQPFCGARDGLTTRPLRALRELVQAWAAESPQQSSNLLRRPELGVPVGQQPAARDVVHGVTAQVDLNAPVFAAQARHGRHHPIVRRDLADGSRRATGHLIDLTGHLAHGRTATLDADEALGTGWHVRFQVLLVAVHLRSSAPSSAWSGSRGVPLQRPAHGHD